VGAAAGAALGALFEPKIKGNIRFRAKYFPLPTPERFEPPADIRRVSVTEGVDWHRLAIDAGGAASTTSGYELCCIVQSEGTGCTALLYRDQQRKHLAVAFRGTCCATDVITDVNLIQEPWVEGEKDAKCMVHAGFRGSLASISRRLKELLVAAAEGDPAQWDLLVCGHSLGGALATMFVADIAEYGIDAGRGLPTVAKSEPWWGRLWGGGPKAANVPPPRPRSLQAYTFGSPRVGNAEFVARFEATGVEAWRVVNSADVVARVPRAMFSTLGGTKSYEHCGPTVLVSAGDGQCPLWIEGVSQGACPVRDGTPITNPFSKGNLLGDVYETTKEHFELATGDLELLKEQMGVDEPEGLLTGLTSAVTMRKAGIEAAATQWKSIINGRLAEAEQDVLRWSSVVGLDPSYLRRELEMMDTLRTGDALMHHLEPAYFGAMRRVLEEGAVVDMGGEKDPLDA